MYIDDIASVYEEEGLKFHVEEDKQAIFLKMDIKQSPGINFIVRIVNSRTVLFETRLPMNIPEKDRDNVGKYLLRVNYHMLLGCFQMGFADGDLKFTVAGFHDEEEDLSEDSIHRLTYLGFTMFELYLPGVFAIIYGGKDPVAAYEEVKREIDRLRQM